MRSHATGRVLALGALSGVLYGLAFPPYDLGPLGWIALAPLVIGVRRAPSGRVAFAAGALAALAACCTGYFWIADMAHRFWRVPWPFAALLLGVFGTFGELHFTLFAALLWRMRAPSERAPAAATALAYTALEMVVPKIFPDALGHACVRAGPLPAAAALAGTHGLSFALAWLGCALGWFGARAVRSRRARVLELGLCAAGLAALAVWGARRDRALAAAAPARTLDVLIVQSNLGDPEELAAQLGSVTLAIDSTVGIYEGMTRRALAGGRADLVVWPETAVPSVPRARIVARLGRMVGELATPLVFGAYDAERRGDRFATFNAAYFMPPTGELRARYYKHKLLVFGEYVPLSSRFPKLLDLLPTPGEFMPGPGPGIFRIGDTRYAPLICYELLFPRVVRASLEQGGEVLLNLTNDYWFGRHGEPIQHLVLSRMRAFETGRPIVRATNTGISALVDGRGRVLQRTGVWEQAVLRGRLPVPAPERTPYARWGDWAVVVLAAGAVLAVAAVWKVVG